jgi:hypothetical protein
MYTAAAIGDGADIVSAIPLSTRDEREARGFIARQRSP